MAAGEEAVANAFGPPVGLVRSSYFIGCRGSLCEVGVRYRGVAQTVADHLIGVGEGESGVLLDDLFGGGSVFEGGPDGVERDTGSADADYSLGGCFEWERFTAEGFCHVLQGNSGLRRALSPSRV